MTEFEEKTKSFLCRMHEARCGKAPTDAYFLRGFILGLIESHWENSGNHGRYTPQLGCYTTKSEENPDGKLTVKAAYENDPKNPTPTPSITIDVGDTALQKLVIGNDTEEDVEHGGNGKGWIASNDVKISHIFRDAETTMIAAQSTLEFIAGVSGDVLSALGLSLFEPLGMSKAKLREQKPDTHFQVDVRLDIKYNFTMSVNLESHKIKTISTQLN